MQWLGDMQQLCGFDKIDMIMMDLGVGKDDHLFTKNRKAEERPVQGLVASPYKKEYKF